MCADPVAARVMGCWRAGHGRLTSSEARCRGRTSGRALGHHSLPFRAQCGTMVCGAGWGTRRAWGARCPRSTPSGRRLDGSGGALGARQSAVEFEAEAAASLFSTLRASPRWSVRARTAGGPARLTGPSRGLSARWLLAGACLAGGRKVVCMQAEFSGSARRLGAVAVAMLVRPFERLA